MAQQPMLQLTRLRYLRCVLLGMCLSSSAAGRLPEISYDEFKTAAPCGYVVEVTDVEIDTNYILELEESLLRGEEVEIQPNITATMGIQTAFGTPDACACGSPYRPTGLFVMKFFSEVHSSHPLPGERAVVFPEVRGGEWREAAYGASYWLILDSTGKRNVRVDWRNDFLTDEHDVESVVTGEMGIVGVMELENLIAAWGEVLGRCDEPARGDPDTQEMSVKDCLRCTALPPEPR